MGVVGRENDFVASAPGAAAAIGAAQILCGGPTAMATVFSCWSAKKPTWRLSGDQKGYEDRCPVAPATRRRLTCE